MMNSTEPSTPTNVERNARYRIVWRHRTDLSRSGKGTKIFTLDEAVALAAELNENYPHINHQIDEIPSI